MGPDTVHPVRHQPGRRRPAPRGRRGRACWPGPRRWPAGSGSTPTIAEPLVLVMIDELAMLTAYLTDRDLSKRADAALRSLLTLGRAPALCGVRVRAGPAEGHRPGPAPVQPGHRLPAPGTGRDHDGVLRRRGRGRDRTRTRSPAPARASATRWTSTATSVAAAPPMSPTTRSANSPPGSPPRSRSRSPGREPSSRPGTASERRGLRAATQVPEGRVNGGPVDRADDHGGGGGVSPAVAAGVGVGHAATVTCRQCGNRFCGRERSDRRRRSVCPCGGEVEQPCPRVELCLPRRCGWTIPGRGWPGMSRALAGRDLPGVRAPAAAMSRGSRRWNQRVDRRGRLLDRRFGTAG